MILTPFKKSDYSCKLEAYFKTQQPNSIGYLGNISDLTDKVLRSVDFRVVTLNYNKDGNAQSFYVLTKCHLPCNNPTIREAVRQQIYGYLQDEKAKAITTEDKHLLNMFSFFMDLGLRTNERDLTKELTAIDRDIFKDRTDLDGKIDAKIIIDDKFHTK